MKKTFLIVAVVALAALGMTSCANTDSCYQFTTSTGGITVITYGYMTKSEADATKANLDTSFSTCTYKRVLKSEADCKN